MPVAKTDETKAAPEMGLAFSRNRVAVLDDQNRFKDAASRYGRGPTFEVVLETVFDLTPNPVPEEEVPAVTAKAVEALAEERASAGGRPLDTAMLIPELELGDLPAAQDQVAGPISVPLEAPPRPLPIPGAPGVDLARLTEFIEERLVHRINEIDGALAGLGFRLQVVSSQLERITGAPQAQPQAQASQSAAAPPAAPKPQPVPVAGESLSLAERRDLRRRGLPVPEPGAPITTEEGLEAPAPGAAVPAGSPKAAFRPSPWLVGPLAAAACLLVALAAWTRWGIAGPSGSAVLVERQAQGLGAYVRAEERALRNYRTPSTEEFMQARAQVLAATGEERERAQAHLTAMVREADAAGRAQKALTTLYQVSGITPETR